MGQSPSAKSVVIDTIVREEVAALAQLSPAEQEAGLSALMETLQRRATEGIRTASGNDDYEFGDVSRAVAESTRKEVQRLLALEWSMGDLSLLLRLGLLISASVTAPVAGLMAMPAHALLSAYSTVLSFEFGGESPRGSVSGRRPAQN